MRKYFSVVAFLLIATTLMAVPARPGARLVTQPDGSTITVYQHGNQYFHYFTDEVGNRLEQREDGFFYAAPALTDAEIERRIASSSRRKVAQQKLHLPSATQTATPLNIAPRGLLVLVSFKDEAFSTDKAEIDSMINGSNYSRSYSYRYRGSTYTIQSTGSARQYFIDQSMGQYKPQFDVVGPYTLPQNMSYYGDNDSQGNDKRPEQMIMDACDLADADGVDFSIYDNNNDGELDFVFVIYAGYGEADGGSSGTIWPHFYWVKEGGYATKYLDGKLLNAYACSNEISAYSGMYNGIGTFCHEFSHVLGFPDFYATNDATHKTLGEWDILDGGPYNNDGNTPPAYSAYERFFMGWLTPEILNEPKSVTLEDIKKSNKAYIITSSGESNLVGNDPNPTEFYILENRQLSGWDKFLPGHGMLLTKIKYSYRSWYNGTPNDDSNNMGIDLIEADGVEPTYGKSGYYGKAKDAFPAGAQAYVPYYKYPIENIKESYGVITFDFMGGVDALEDIEAAENNQKVIYQGQIYIHHNGEWYDIMGRKL